VLMALIGYDLGRVEIGMASRAKRRVGISSIRGHSQNPGEGAADCRFLSARTPARSSKIRRRKQGQRWVV
jgi:hypothetical protein